MIGQLDKNYLKQRKRKIVKRLFSYFLFEGRPLTTKGRWINILLFPFLRFLSLFQISKKTVKPIYIAGIGRSGTTYLGKVLSLYPKVSYLNEPKILWYIANKRDDINGNYDERKQGKYLLGKKDVTKQISKTIFNLYSNYLFFTNGKYVLDKYPEVIFRLDYVKEIFNNFKTILIVRNGWDVINSISNWSNRLGKYETGSEDWWGKDNVKWIFLVEQVAKHSEYLDLEIEQLKNIENQQHRAAIEYIITMEYGLKIQKKYPDNVLLIKYEDFSDNPVEKLKTLEGFLDWPSSQNVYDYVESSASKSKYVDKAKLPDYIKIPFEQINHILYPEVTS